MKKTHVVAGLAIAYAFGLDPVHVVIGTLLPDADYKLLHRRLLHNLFVLFLVLFLSFEVFVGMLSHITLDMLTKMGVGLLWPVSRRMFRVGEFRTGGIFDWVLFVLFLVSWIYFDLIWVARASPLGV